MLDRRIVHPGICQGRGRVLFDLLCLNSGLLLLPVNRHDDFSLARFDITFEVKDLLPGS